MVYSLVEKDPQVDMEEPQETTWDDAVGIVLQWGPVAIKVILYLTNFRCILNNISSKSGIA